MMEFEFVAAEGKIAIELWCIPITLEDSKWRNLVIIPRFSSVPPISSVRSLVRNKREQERYSVLKGFSQN